MAFFNFDDSQDQLQQNLEPLPPGWYPAVMIESELVPTTNKDGVRLKCVFEIIDGPGKGRKQQCGFNVENPNPEAVRIARSELKTMKVCMGVLHPIGDTQELHGRPLQIRLAKQKDSDYNEVKGFKSATGQDAKDVLAAGGGAALPPMGHQQQPPQGFGNAPAAPYSAPPAPPAPPAAPAADPTAGWQRQNGYRLNPHTNAWEQDVPAAPPAPPAPPAAPPAPPAAAWAPPVAPQAPPAHTAPPAPPAPPAWTPNTAPPAPPSWTPPAA